MPMGGGDPKTVGDGQLVKIRPEVGRGGSDLWDLRDALVGLMEERTALIGAITGAANFANMQARVAALSPVNVLVDNTL